MATVSPITINTSSPRSFRIPTITPPSLQRPSKKPVSSSPQLPSPSAFVKPHVPVLKSGSRAQEAPKGVSIGFASAASLWKNSKFEAEEVDIVSTESKTEKRVKADVAKPAEKHGVGTNGKLKKPKRKVKEPVLAEASTTPPLPKDFVYCGSPLALGSHVDTLARPDLYDIVTEPICNAHATSRSPSASLTKYVFEYNSAQIKSKDVAQARKHVKKARKPPAKSTEGNEVTVAKRSRKKKAKSESIILNSDEPDTGDGATSIRLEHVNEASRDMQARAKDNKTKRRAAKISEGEKENVAPFRPSASPTTSLRISQTDDPAMNKPRETSDQSTYFAKSEVPTLQPVESTSNEILFESPEIVQKLSVASDPPLQAQSITMARRRRRDWTPVKDTSAVHPHDSRPQTADSEVSNASHLPHIQLTDILNNFTYASVAPDSAVRGERTPTGEAVTKRRRIELSESLPATSTSSKAGKDITKDKPKKAKGVKQPKKKPHTVTAQATSAYLPPKEIQTPHGTVSAFFSPPKGDAAATGSTLGGGVHEAQPTVTKPKKPRKPRAKPGAVANADASATVETKKKRPKKKDAVTDEAKEFLRLYSPSQATAQMKRQDFLFGTSSQLAPAESPEFIRQTQVAMKESEKTEPDAEEDVQLQGGLLVYPSKMLWDISARDSEGGLLQKEVLNDLVGTSVPEITESDHTCPVGKVYEAGHDAETGNPGIHTAMDTLTKGDIAPREHAEEIVEADRSELPVNVSRRNPPSNLEQSKLEEDVDDWIILSSNDTAHIKQPTESKAQSQSPLSARLLSPKMFRPALNPLDSNASLTFLKSPDKAPLYSQIRPFSLDAQNQTEPSKRPRGRPRKDATVATGSLASPKKIGRPSKTPIAASSPTHTTSKKAKMTASQPDPQSTWLDIDEISDCDAPNTPSPPRRRASSSPPALRPLQLSPSNSQTAEEIEPAASRSRIVKPDGPQWPSMKAKLFPRITSTVKSAPRSNDPANLSWWQKILMYDPLVVEDLTAWLNKQGLSVEVRKAKAKKNKKRKADVESDANEADADYEICQEPLQPWMVQKWCEEKSICCYMKDGSWRTKR